MFKRLDPTDVDKTPFKVYKQFSLTEADSGSFVYNFRAISGSHRNYIPLTADKTTFHNNGDIIGKTMKRGLVTELKNKTKINRIRR